MCNLEIAEVLLKRPLVSFGSRIRKANEHGSMAVAEIAYFFVGLSPRTYTFIRLFAGDISGRLGDKLGANRFGELWGVHVSGT